MTSRHDPTPCRLSVLFGRTWPLAQVKVLKACAHIQSRIYTVANRRGRPAARQVGVGDSRLTSARIIARRTRP